MAEAAKNGAAPAALNPDAIPAELKSWPQWVARRGKVLVDPKTGGNAKTNAPSTRGTFDDAVAPAARDGLRGSPQWVARRGKVLVDPKTGGNAKTNAPSPWGAFDDAVARSETDGLDG